jgi:large subunit ribosomal protein L9
MKIILKEDVQGLGYKDDVVEVKAGYGRNFLIPTGKAVIATPSALKVLAENQRQRAHKLAKIKADAEALAAQIQGVENLVIAAKTSETGTVFGSVNAAQLAEALEKNGITVDRKLIVVAPVKEVGKYTATVNLHKEVSAELSFEVVAE